MDRATFREAVRLARFVLENSPHFRMTPGEAHARALALDVSSKRELVSTLVPLSEHERWAWNALSAMAQWELLHPYEAMPDELAEWTADVLGEHRRKPNKGDKRHVKRDLAIADTVLFVTRFFDVKPTRNRSRSEKRCAEGGSASDVVGAVLNMGYKNIERIWTGWGDYAIARFDGWSSEPIVAEDSQDLETALDPTLARISHHSHGLRRVQAPDPSGAGRKA